MSETGTENANMEITESDDQNQSFKILLASRPATDPKENLTWFSHLVLSPDDRTLYFETDAWATSHAIHSIDLASGKVSFITDGEIACVVLAGEFQGDLVVQKHRYFVQGGAHDDLWLVKPSGNEIGLVAQGTDASNVCPDPTQFWSK